MDSSEYPRKPEIMVWLTIAQKRLRRSFDLFVSDLCHLFLPALLSTKIQQSIWWDNQNLSSPVCLANHTHRTRRQCLLHFSSGSRKIHCCLLPFLAKKVSDKKRKFNQVNPEDRVLYLKLQWQESVGFAKPKLQ